MYSNNNNILPEAQLTKNSFKSNTTQKVNSNNDPNMRSRFISGG